MNDVSIIIDNERYDAVKLKTEYSCEECDLRHLCEKAPYMCLCLILDVEENKCFKKSDKKFEK